MKKVVGIILVFCILLGSSTIYASGLPRTSLSKWYSQSFQKESEGKASLAVPNDTTITVKEIKAPQAYKLNSTPINITVSPGEVKELTITNEKIDSKLKLIKQDSQTNQPLSGAEFNLSNINKEMKK